MSHISERTQQKTRRMIFHAIRTLLNTVPPDGTIDEFFRMLHFDSEAEIIGHVLMFFQSNPLFTPEFSDAISSPSGSSICQTDFEQFSVYGIRGSEWELDPEKLIVNPEWDLYDIYNTLPDDDQSKRFFLQYAEHHPQFTRFMTDQGWWDYYDHRIHGTEDSTRTETLVRCHKNLSIADCTSIICDYGGLRNCVKENRIFNSMLQNSGISFGQIMNILLDLEYDNFWKNPFAIYGTMIHDLYIYKQDNLHEILTELFERCDLETIVRNPTDYSCNALTCLLAMVSQNKAWDVNMDSEFGGRVWFLIKILWDIEWERNVENLEKLGYYTSDDKIDSFKYLQDLVCLWNPNFYVPDRITDNYTHIIRHGNVSRLQVICSEILQKSCILIERTPDAFVHTYETCVLNKDMLRIRDVGLVRPNITSIYNREKFASKATFRGEYGMIIGRFLFTKMIIPMRRDRGMRILKNVLSRIREKSGRDVSKYSYTMNCITSFMTS